MKMFCLYAVLLLGWLGIAGAGGGTLRAQQKVVYNQYFYFNSFETEADLVGWQAQRPYGSEYAFDGKRSISPTNGFILTPEFDLSALEEPVLSFTGSYTSDFQSKDYFSRVYVMEANGKYKEIAFQVEYKADERIWHYLVSVPKTAKRLKFEKVDYMDAFCIYDRKQEIPLSDGAFFCDFDRESDLQGWEHTGENNGFSGDFYLSNFSHVVTPELDLTAMRDPMLIYSWKGYRDTIRMLVSADGVRYDTLGYCNVYSDKTVGRYLLPRNTKRIKFEMVNKKEYYNNSFYKLCIRDAYLVPWLDEPQPVLTAWIIPQDNGGLKWERYADSLVLKGTAAAGTMARLVLPECEEYHWNYAFRLRNPGPSKVKVEFNRKEITDFSGEIIQKVSGSEVSYLKFTSLDGSPVEVAVSGLRLLRDGNEKSFAYQPERWYDDIPDNGMMEFGEGVRNDGYLYEVKAEGVFAYRKVENFLSFQNLNNDSVVDFITGKSSSYDSYNNVIVRRDDGTVYEKKYVGRDVLVADLNSDGRPDLVPNDEYGRTYVQLPDGTFEQHLMNIQSYEAWKNGGKNDEWSSGTGGFVVSDGIPGIRDDMFVRDGVTTSFGKLGTMLTDLDFNHDGRPDLLNENTGQLLINLGSDNYVAMQLNGKIYFRDLNGDGKLDYVLYDEDTKTVRAVVDDNGTVREQTLITNLSMDDKIWCYDFDRDGDVDVLLPFSYKVSNGAAFLVMEVNDGKGNFTEQESYFDEHFLFKDCADIDRDGYMDVVAQYGEQTYSDYYDSWSTSYTTPYQAVLLKGGGNLQFTLQSTPLVTFKSSRDNIMVADVNQDGIYEIVESESSNSYDTAKINYLTGIPANTPPSRPAAPSFVYDRAGNYLKVSWALGEDAESSSVDLTYALRIGTEPGKGDMLYAHAYADGRRRNLLDGNMGYNLDKILNVASWPEGKYYIAVQAVDPMHSGSAWSEEAVFEKAGLSAAFIISTPKSTVDTMVVAYGGKVNKAYTYAWDFDDAEVCRVNADSSVYVLRWAEPGEKTISLQVSDGQGNSSAVESKTFDIFANQFVTSGITFDPECNGVCALVDLDGNGVMDALTGNGVYENDGEAYFTKVKKIYNTNLAFDRDVKLVDMTGDGMAEIVDFMRGNTVDIFKNTGNMNLSQIASSAKITVPKYPYDNYNPGEGQLFDIDNNGKVDYFTIGGDYSSGFYIYKNTGYLSWEKTSTTFFPCYSRFFVDLNNDGLVDVVGCDKKSVVISGSTTYERFLVLYMNQGNFNFKRIEIPNPFENKEYLTISAVADVNSDGYPDLIVVKNVSTIVVCLNNQNQDFNRIIEINLPIEGMTDLSLGAIKDYDNNGYPDLMLEARVHKNMTNYTDHGMVYFYPDGQWKYWHYGLTSSGFIGVSDNKLLADLNGDGTLDCCSGFYAFLNQTQVTNTPPDAPANIRAVQTDTTVLIEWDAARDQESLPAQMRYNVSVKKKGATGDGAFVISPLNGLNDKAAIIPSHYYRTATRMEIPLSAMPIGDYEIQIQAFDAWDAHSPFSPVYDFSVQKSVNIKVPAVACLNTAVTVRYVGTEDPAALQWDWDGGRLVKQEDGVYEVAWSSAGNKKVTVEVDGVASSASIFVKTAPDLNFEINAHALENSLTPLTLPELALDPSYELTWQISRDGSAFAGPAACKDALTIARRGVTRDVQVRFMKSGDYTLRLQATTESCGKVEASRQVQVKGSLPVPQIGLVTVDAATAKNKLRWGVPADLPEYAGSINIYKEGSKYNDFYLLANVPLTQTEFVDQTSNPEVTSSRYRMTLVTDWGAEGEPGTAHRSVHVMICKGMGNSWNLIWTPYEGAIVESFRVLRGTSPDALSVIGEVAGSAMSWSDMTAPEGTLYYALEFDSEYDDTWTPMLRMARTSTRASVRSNVVGIVDAADAVLAESLAIRCTEKEIVLNPEQPSLHLYAEVSPFTATYRRVNWQILSGQELAAVDAQGTLTVKGNVAGVVKVCAIAVDGSDARDTITVSAERWEAEVTDVAVTDAIGCWDSENGELQVTAKGGDGKLVYSINGGADWLDNGGKFVRLKGGDYHVLVKDELGTEAAWEGNPVHIGAPAPVVIDTVELRPLESDGLTRVIITASGGSGYKKYYSFYNDDDYWREWSYIDCISGSYYIRVKDENGCIAEYRHNPVIVLAPGELGITAVTSSDVSVAGGADGEIHITATGGAGTLSYSVDGGVTYTESPDFTGLAAGEYLIWVKDENDQMVCYAANPVVIREPEAFIVITDVAVTDVAGCYEDRTGEIRITADSDTDSLEYSLNGNWQASNHFTGLSAGSYRIAVRDAEGHITHYVSNPVEVRQPERLDFSIDTVFVSEVYGQKLDITSTGGSGTKEYTIDGGMNWQATGMFEGLVAGSYDVRVRDANGCEAGKILQLYTPVREMLQVASVEVVPVSVYGGADGEIRIAATGGVGTLSYSVDNGQTYQPEADFRNLTAGIYQVVVKDAVGDMAYYPANPVAVVQPDAPKYVMEIENFRLQGGAAVTASREVTLEQHVTGGVPQEYQVCEDTLQAGDRWLPYRELPVYELNGQEETDIRVYMRVRNARGISHWASAAIRYEQARKLTVVRVSVNEGKEMVTEVSVRLQLVVAGGIATEMQVAVDGGQAGWQAFSSQTLCIIPDEEGEHVCRVKVRNAAGESDAVEVRFCYKRAPGKLKVEDFTLNQNSLYTRSREVDLDYWIDGPAPEVYAVSERADMEGVQWLRYRGQPSYLLSEKAGMKTVYFAVARGRDTSEVVSASILLEDAAARDDLNVRTWPNPVEQVLHVMLTGDEVAEETEIRIYTAMGQLVERRVYAGRELSVDVSRCPFGILFVEFVNGGRKVTRQIVKK